MAAEQVVPIIGSARPDRAASPALPAAVEELVRQAAALAGRAVDVDGAEATRLHARLRSAIDLLGGVSARLLARVEDDGRWAASGSARTFPEWVARQHGTSVGSARREATLGRALESALPATDRALAEGSISLEHAQVLAQVAPTSEGRVAALRSADERSNEEFLLAQARRLGVDQFRREARRWAVRVDEGAAERDHERAVAKEHLTLSPRDDGLALTGFLTHEHGTALVTALRAVTGVPSADDERSHPQRDAAALGDLARLVLAKGLAGGGAQVRPQIVVTVDFPTFRGLVERAAETDEAAARLGGEALPRSSHAGGQGGAAKTPRSTLRDALAPATLDSGEPIPASVLSRLACDAEVTRVVFGPAGQVLDVGRGHRTYSGHLRRAVVARDRHCRYPGCAAPPHLGEVHHVRQWVRDHGETSVANGILLCWHHHEVVHRRNLRIRREPHGWSFTRSDGRPIHAEPHGAAPPPARPAARTGPHAEPPPTPTPTPTATATPTPTASPRASAEARSAPSPAWALFSA